jgi:hypothetical protein
MRAREYFYRLLRLNGQETGSESFSSMARRAEPSSSDRNAGIEEKSARLRQALARIREIFWHLSA